MVSLYHLDLEMIKQEYLDIENLIVIRKHKEILKRNYDTLSFLICLNGRDKLLPS